MARNERVYRVCDMPHTSEQEGATPALLTIGGSTYEVDLCEKHTRQHLEPLLSAGMKLRGVKIVR